MALRSARLDGLALARAALDRRADLRARPGLLPQLLADPSTRVCDLVGDSALMLDGPAPRLRLRPPSPEDDAGRALFLGHGLGPDARTAYVAILHAPAEEDGEDREAGPPDGVAARGLRSVGAHLDARDAGIFTTALALANWHRTHQHCPRCGAQTEAALAGWTRRCPVDDSEHYPRTDPAVIMSVVDDEDRLLLAEGRGFRAGGMSVLAGFVEPGESLSAAVAREVLEEVGVEVSDITYLGDQPWPFPASLMIGFTARALTTELTLQDEEITRARWFTRAALAGAVADGSLHLSPRLSIARRLIEHWYGAEVVAPGAGLRG